MNVVMGVSLFWISWWEFFSFTVLIQWHLEMSYPLECDWLSLIVLGQLKLSCSLALICCAAGFSPTRPQKGLKEQRNCAELKSCAWKLSQTWQLDSNIQTRRWKWCQPPCCDWTSFGKFKEMGDFNALIGMQSCTTFLVCCLVSVTVGV